jgi:pseudolysin
VVSVFIFGSMSVYAAKPVNLSHQPVSILKSYISTASNLRSAAINADEVRESARAIDANHMTHIRLQQFHAGYPVWGAHSVVHVPASQKNFALSLMAVSASSVSSMNGKIFQDIDADLANTSRHVFTSAQAEKAKIKVQDMVKSEYGIVRTKVNRQELMVYVDEHNKAHYAFFVSIYVEAAGINDVPAIPTYILDAETFDVYKNWNAIKTAHFKDAKAGGYGGNTKTGKLIYDGLPGDLSVLAIVRDPQNICFLKNPDVDIFDATGGKRLKETSFKCGESDSKHNNVFWDGSMDTVNGGYSPANDALYAGTNVQSLYKEWYHLPMLTTHDGKPMLLRIYTHFGKKWENAEWDDMNREIHLGDGADGLYPLTSLGVVAHEVSHGFTSQHSNLNYADQSGSMNESFSDMAAQAAELYATGKNTWEIGSEVIKEENSALRYMDKPSNDCRKGRNPGEGCSIDSASQYAYSVKYAREELGMHGDRLQSYIVHTASGVYNHMFYFLANSEGWGVKKAFEVMIHANSYYWTPETDFHEGACGVMKSAKDLHYDTSAVADAFSKTGIDTKQC